MGECEARCVRRSSSEIHRCRIGAHRRSECNAGSRTSTPTACRPRDTRKKVQATSRARASTRTASPVQAIAKVYLAAWCAEDCWVECRRAFVLLQGFNAWPDVADEELAPCPWKQHRGPARVSDIVQHRDVRAAAGPLQQRHMQPVWHALHRGAVHVLKCFGAADSGVHEVRRLPRGGRPSDRVASVRSQLRLAALTNDRAASLLAGHQRRDRSPNKYTMPASVQHRNEFLKMTAPQLDTNTNEAPDKNKNVLNSVFDPTR